MALLSLISIDKSRDSFTGLRVKSVVYVLIRFVSTIYISSNYTLNNIKKNIYVHNLLLSGYNTETQKM